MRTRRTSRSPSGSCHPARVIVASVVVTAMGGVASASTAQDVPSAAAALAEAQRSRQAAERRLADLSEQLDQLSAEVERRFVGAAELAASLEDARSKMRASAIAAFVEGGLDDASLAIFTDADPSEIAGRRTFSSSRSLDWADAAAEFQALQRDNDPELVALVDRREALASRVADARDALFQASAVEADAERASAEESRRAAAAAAQAAAAEEAAVRATTTLRPRAGAPKAAPTTTRPPAARPPVTTAPVAPPSNLVLLTEPSAPLPDLPPGGPSPEAWLEVRQCESSNNYRAVSRSGRYRGAYQFDQQTWEAVGGRGDPAAALPLEQDARARLLFIQRGSRAWPQCGLALI